MNGPAMGDPLKGIGLEPLTQSAEDLRTPATEGSLSDLRPPPSDKGWSKTENAEVEVRIERPRAEFKLENLPRAALGYDDKGNAVSMD